MGCASYRAVPRVRVQKTGRGSDLAADSITNNGVEKRISLVKKWVGGLSPWV